MKRKRFSEEQIIGILKEHVAGVSVCGVISFGDDGLMRGRRWKKKSNGVIWTSER